MSGAASKLIAVSSTQEGLAGVIVWWRLSGDASLEELTAEWEAAGLPAEELPSATGPAAALTRALGEHRGKRSLVRPLDADDGKALVEERANGEDLTYDVALRAKVDGLGRLVIDPPDHAYAKRLRAAYELHLARVADVGGWLVRRVRALDGVALRDTGGIYYLPPSSVPTWEKIATCLHLSSGHRVNGVPAMRTDDAVASILDALTVEATAAAEEMEAELREGLTPKKADHRVVRCAEVEAKVARYEALLGSKTDALVERLENLRASLAAVALASAPSMQEAS
jgi:hypothetical protein